MSLRDDFVVRYKLVSDRERAFQGSFIHPLLAGASRRIDDIVAFDGLQQLLAHQTIREYQGFDPTKPDLHIGHLISFLLHRDFQRAGHKVIFLIGGFTAMVGDPTERDSVRKKMTEDEVDRNAVGYQDQAGLVLDFSHPTNPARVLNNRDWLAPLSLREFVELSSYFSWRDITNRDFFRRRMEAGDEIHFNELYYPLLQGYDSVAMKVNLEIGGSDQFYNMMIGRDMVRYLQHREKHVLTTPLLKSPEGEKMSKTGQGVVVTLTAAPNDFFRGIMRLEDAMVIQALCLLTDLDFAEIGRLEARFAQGGTNDILEVKGRLAHEVTALYHGEKQAVAAQRNYSSVSQGQIPEDVETYHIPLGSLADGRINVVDALSLTGILESKAAARRLVTQGGVRVNQQLAVRNDLITQKQLEEGVFVQIGRSRVYRLMIGE